jgi:transposase
MNPDLAPSYETIVKFFHNHRYSRKVMERRHILRDEDEIMEFRMFIATIMVNDMVLVDETCSSPDEFQAKYGWAIEGEKAMCTQFKIGNKHYSAMAAYTPRGFRHWKIIEGSTNAEMFQEFMDELRVQCQADDFLVLDNCKIHKTPESLMKITQVFRGRYRFLPKYSPHWNPIELGFSQIKRYLRDRESIIMRNGSNVIEEIDAAFFLYSENGPRSLTAAGNWSRIIKNFAFFNEFAL